MGGRLRALGWGDLLPERDDLLRPRHPAAACGEVRALVGAAEFAATNNPGLTLATYSPGSCLGVAFHDSVRKAGALEPELRSRNGERTRAAQVSNSAIGLKVSSLGVARDERTRES